MNSILPSVPCDVSISTSPLITTSPVKVTSLSAVSEVVIFPDNVIPVAWLLVIETDLIPSTSSGEESALLPPIRPTETAPAPAFMVTVSS